MRQQILSGDANYKMPSNKLLTKAFQEKATRWWQGVLPAEHTSGPARQKHMNICSLADRTELKHTATLKIGATKGSQENHMVS